MGSKLLDLFFGMNGFHSLLRIQNLNLLTPKARPTSSSPQRLDLVHLAPPTDITNTAKSALRKKGWEIEDHGPVHPFSNLKPKSTVLIIDELSSPVLAKIDEQQWVAIKELAAQDHNILWVTTGSQFQVSKPDNALIHGLARTMRAEDPLLTFVTLDVESSTGRQTVDAISRVLKEMVKGGEEREETEFVERGGVVYVSRVRVGEKISPTEKKDDAELEVRDLHESKTVIKLQCERVGTLDSLRWVEIAGTETQVKDDMVEVEIHAASLNFKVSFLSFYCCCGGLMLDRISPSQWVLCLRMNICLDSRAQVSSDVLAKTCTRSRSGNESYFTTRERSRIGCRYILRSAMSCLMRCPLK
jgi:hypothetical protein